MGKSELERLITVKILVNSQSEQSTGDTIKAIQGLVDDLAFDENTTAVIEFEVRKKKFVI